LLNELFVKLETFSCAVTTKWSIPGLHKSRAPDGRGDQIILYGGT